MGVLERNQETPAPFLICVVDDNQSVRCAMANLLASAGYRAICFDSAEACMSSGRLSDIDFAVLDVRLSGMSGFALQEHLAAAQIRIPLVLVSGHADSGMEQHAIHAGAIALLRKPIDVDLLLAHIARTLDARGRRQ
jgi:FixJ family two-component response regulator